MNHLWAPWRRVYFEQPKGEGCVFCSIAGRQMDSEDYVLHRGETVFLSLNRFPYNVGHAMIIPYRHFENLEELDEKESKELFEVLKLGTYALKAVLKPDGFNIGANIGSSAGAGMQHFHIHIVPRWLGDTNFMPVLAETKVLSNNLDKVWRELSQEIKKR